MKQEMVCGLNQLGEVRVSSQTVRLTPLEGLLLCMHWAIKAKDRAGILAAATAAAPYCRPKLSTTDIRVDHKPEEKMTDKELEREIAELECRIAETKKLN